MKMGVGAKVDLELDVGDDQLVLIKGNENSVCFDLENIVPDGDGWVDGFELSWKEIYQACKEYVVRS